MSWVAVGIVGGSIASSLLAPKPDNSGSQMAGSASQQMANISSDQWNFFKQNYQPIITSLTNEAQYESSPEAMGAALGRAAGDVNNSYSTALKNAKDTMGSYGINPGSGAFESNVGTINLAQGAAKAGALTSAYNTQKNLAYNRLLSAGQLGMGIPNSATAAASGSANAAGVMQNSLNSQFAQNQQNMANAGGIGGILGGVAGKWYGSSNPGATEATPTTPTTVSNSSYGIPLQNFNSTGNLQYADGGLVPNEGMATNENYAKGGRIIDGEYSVVDSAGLKKRLMTGAITHHMRAKQFRFANGGGVGTQGMTDAPSQTNDVVNGPGTETSDSIPATVGQKPAALSNGEFVMVAEVPKMSGKDILQAINAAGLQMRSKDVSNNAGMTAYCSGGGVRG